MTYCFLDDPLVGEISLDFALPCPDFAAISGNLTEGGLLGRGDCFGDFVDFISLNNVDCCLAAGIRPFSRTRLFE